MEKVQELIWGAYWVWLHSPSGYCA